MIRGEEEEEEEEGGSTNVLDNETEKQQGCNTSQDQVEWLTDEVKKKQKKKTPLSLPTVFSWFLQHSVMNSLSLSIVEENILKLNEC